MSVFSGAEGLGFKGTLNPKLLNPNPYSLNPKPLNPLLS